MRRRTVAIILIVLILGSAFGVFFVFTFLGQFSPLPHEMICQFTGEDALNDTTVVNVYGADVGLMVEWQDRLHFIFGDTFGPDNWDWRSNTMAYTLDTAPSDGIVLTDWITDNVTHFAKELIPSLKVDEIEMTVIPTTAYSSGDCLYVYFMSVNTWGEHGDWTSNNASIAYSFDGNTFFKATNMSWPGTSNFIEWGLVKGDDSAPSTGGYLYFLTTGSGRFHNCFLVRVPENHVLNQSSYQYYAGLGTGDAPSWSSDQEAAHPVLEAPTGEISVMWNTFLGRYMLMNLDDVQKQILIRTADSPWGPWSTPRIIIQRPEYVGFYAPNIDPILVEDDGRIVYFTMSLWYEYNVYLMKVDLTPIWSLASHHLLMSWLVAGLVPLLVLDTIRLCGNNIFNGIKGLGKIILGVHKRYGT